MGNGWTADQIAAIKASLQEGKSHYEIARTLEVRRESVRLYAKRLAESGELGFKPVLPGYAIKKTSTQLGPDGELQREWIQQSKAPGEVFEMPAGHQIKGVSALVDGEGRELFKWIKTKEDGVDTLALIKAAFDELKQDLPRVVPSKGPEFSNQLLLNQFTITDLHFGMLAWGEETGGDNYDLQIAEKLLLDWFSAAIAMSPRAKVAVLAQLGDLMHHDGLEAVTPTSKHVLDADSRLQKIIRVVIRVIRQIISMLLETHEIVHVVMAQGNHDLASSAWLREAFHVIFENEPRVIIDNSPDTYYAYEHGKTSLFYHHGHRRKVQNVDHVFVGKFREMYGRSDHSYGHVGHLHSDEVVESNLMRVERHRTLAAPDAHAGGGGWLSKRDAKVITYHKEFGEVSRITLSPQMVSRQVA